MRLIANSDQRKLGTKSIAIAIVCPGLIALSACAGSSRGGDIPYGVQSFGEPDPPSQTTLVADYRISPLDKLTINVFQVADLSGEYQVDLLGNVALPLIGSMRAVDRTPAELQSDLETKLSESYLKNPKVSVGVLEATGSMVTVEGGVREPGIFPTRGKTTLLQTIAMAKGLDETGNPKRVAVFRQIDGERMAAAFDLTTIRSGADSDPTIYRGDIIVVESSKSRRAFLDVVRAIPILGVFTPMTYR